QEGMLPGNWTQKAPPFNSSSPRVIANPATNPPTPASPAYSVDGNGVVTTIDLRPNDQMDIDFGNQNPDCPNGCIPDSHGRILVTKDVNPSWQQKWKIQKAVDQQKWFTQGGAQPTYTVTVSKDGSLNFQVSGTITLSNPTTVDVTVN